jgi:hypothetical protein
MVPPVARTLTRALANKLPAANNIIISCKKASFFSNFVLIKNSFK